jgi:hypothetical protein
MEDWDDLRREYHRVSILLGFDNSQRIWWLYLRNAAERWLERNEDPAVRTAHDRLKNFPEHLPDEPDRWLALRQEVARVLAEEG